MRKQTLVLLTILFLSVAFCGVVSAADGDVVYVDVASGNDNNNGFTPATAKLTIKNGTGTVNDNGVVNIANGTYTGTGNTHITITKNMKINGQSQTGTIINAENNTWIFSIAPSITVTISQLTLTNGTASDGGAIYNQGQLTCTDCQFTDNNATFHGGAIFTQDDSVVTCTDCEFTENKASYGGAIGTAGELTCTGCQFTDNESNDEGGAIYNQGQLICTNCQFTDNNATFYGGAIFTQDDSVVTCTDCQFTKNEASRYGGVIYNHGDSVVTCTDCEFAENKASDGGAIFNEDSSVVTCTGCQFTDNYAVGAAGAIANTADCVVTCTGCQFTENNADDAGGAIATAADSVVTCTGCQFIGNSARYGGAIAIAGELTCTGCQFTDNEANDGGAIYIYNGAVTVIGSILENNKAGNDGGVIFNNDDGNFTFNFNRIIGNTAEGDGQDIYDENTDPADTHNALYNWWGSNAGAAAGRIEFNRLNFVEYDPWLVMKYDANPTTIKQGETSTLTADFRHDSDGAFHEPVQGHLLDGTPVTFTTNLGNVGSKSVVKFTLNGVATAILRGDEAAGAALTSATLDNQTLYSTVNINARTVEAATTQSTTKTVGMQKTGTPFAGIVLALLMVFGGFISTRKKQ